MRNYKIAYLENRHYILGQIPYSESWHASNSSNNAGTIFAIPKDARMAGI